VGGLRGGRFLPILGEKAGGTHGLPEERQTLPDSSPGLDARRLENYLFTPDECVSEQVSERVNSCFEHKL